MQRRVIAVGAALVLITINLRLAIGSVSPVLDDIEETLGLSSTSAGLLTTLPVLCFGLAAPLAPRLAARFGQEALLAVTLLAVLLGVLARAIPAVGPLFLGTLVLGVGIAVANVLMPSIIKRRFERPGLMLGLFTMALSVGAAIGAAFTVPLENLLGNWTWALAAWSIPALIALFVWMPEVRRSGPGPSEGTGAAVHLWGDRTAWYVALMFAFQSVNFYCLVAWLPDILRDAGLSSGTAGAMLSLSMLCGIPSSLVLPVIMYRWRTQSALILFSAVPWIAGLIGVLADPAGPTWLWMVLNGIGQGGGIAFGLTLVVLRAPDARHAASLSGMAQTAAYLIAATGPFVLGAVHDATGTWDAPILIMIGVSVAMAVFGFLSGRDRFVEGRRIPPIGGSSPAEA